MHLLRQLLASRPRSCFVLDTHDLYKQYHDEPEIFQDLINQFRGLIDSLRTAQGCMKVFILYYGSNMPAEPPHGSQHQELACSLQYRPVPPKLQTRHSTKTAAQRIRLKRTTDVNRH